MKRLVSRALALSLLLIPLVHAAPVASAPLTAPAFADPKLFVGANVPWFNWGCDFGCMGTNGASSPQVQGALAEGFGRLKNAGVHTVRWWTFEGDPWQINKDASGAPATLNPGVYADFDAALALADKYDLVYDFVLFNAPSSLPRPWLEDPAQRQRLADALGPLFDRYKDNPRVGAWEIFNEPEWEIWNNKIGAAPVQDTVKLLADTIHRRSKAQVTIGSASIEGLPLWVGYGLDFYSPHWYDPMTGDNCARCADAASVRSKYGLDGLPIVIGELYAGPDTDTLQRFQDFRAKGYAGAWAWSLFFDHTGDKMKFDLAAATTFTANAASQPQARPQPAPANVTAPSVQLLANWVSPTYVTAGGDVTFHQDVRTLQDTNVALEFDVLAANGDTVSTATLDNQSLIANGVASLSAAIKLPTSLPAGQYTVKTAMYSPGRTSLYASSDSTGSFVLEAAPPTPTPVPTPPPDTTPVEPGDDTE